MPTNITKAKVAKIPTCDVDGTNPAYADAYVPFAGRWGYVCHEHFDTFGCRLGTGLGQELILDQGQTDLPTYLPAAECGDCQGCRNDDGCYKD